MFSSNRLKKYTSSGTYFTDSDKVLQSSRRLIRLCELLVEATTSKPDSNPPLYAIIPFSKSKHACLEIISILYSV